MLAEEEHDWRFSVQLGQAKVRGTDADLIARLPAGATLLSSQWRDTSYAFEIDYLLSPRWSLSVGYSNLGKGIAVIQADTVDPDATHRAAAGIQPMLVKGYTLGVNFDLLRDEDYDVTLGAGFIDWEADMESRMGSSVIRLYDEGSDTFWRLAVDYKLDENWRLGAVYRYLMLPDQINDFALKVSYQF